MEYNVIVDVIKDETATHLWKRGWVGRCREIMQKTYQSLQIDRPARAKIAVLLTDNTTMRGFNFQYLGHDSPTNVLSFPAELPKQPHQVKFLGDIALGYEIIEQESLDNNISFSAHFHHLCVHGLLHIMGYDHIKETDAQIMEAEEIRILNQIFSIPNPYLSYV